MGQKMDVVNNKTDKSHENRPIDDSQTNPLKEMTQDLESLDQNSFQCAKESDEETLEGDIIDEQNLQ